MDHINSIDPNIRFTSEDPIDDGCISFLDILIIPEKDGKLNTTVYRKPTHTDLYLHWDSHHTIPSKYSVVSTLYHRANTICSTPQHLQKEEKHLSQALKGCKYPTWALNRVKLKSQETSSHSTKRNIDNSKPTQQSSPKPNIVVPYYQGLSEVSKELAENMESRCI